MRTRAIAFSLLCALFVAACGGDPIGPEDLAGFYSLVSSGEDEQPRELLSASENCDEWLVSGTLSLREDATYSLELGLEIDCTRGGGEIVPDERSSTGTFSVSGRMLTFAGESGTLSADELGGVVRGGVIEIIVPDLAAAGDLKLVFERVLFVAE